MVNMNPNSPSYQPQNNSVDIHSDLGYNVTNDAHEVEIVKMAEMEPINDTSCTHEKLVADPLDTIGAAVYHGCQNPKCGAGFYLKQ